MCNRYSQTKRERDVSLGFNSLQMFLTPRYNIAPTNIVTVVFAQGRKLQAEPMVWQFSRSDGGIVTNCKSETAVEKSFFKSAWKNRRCLIPADGFYEWKPEGKRKQAFRFILKSGEAFWFAGLWNPAAGKQEGARKEFVILTKPANVDVAAVHVRMPLILQPGEINEWLYPASEDWIPGGVEEGSLEAYPVSSLVSWPGVETPGCIVPLVPETSQEELF